MALKGSTDTVAATEAAVTDNSKSFIRSYVRNSILENRKILIVITALNLLSFPLALISLTYDLYQQNMLSKASPDEYVYYSGNSGWFMALAVMFTTVAVFSGVLIALNNFSYLHKKQNVDMYLALPLKNSQRFLCDYFSGLVCYVGPFLIAGAATLIISFFSMNIVPEMGNPIADSMHLPGFIIRCYLGAACIMIMFYTLTVLVCTICGSLFETRFYTALINGLIPGMIAIIVLVLFGGGFGLIYEEYITPILSKTSPIGALIGIVLYADMNEEGYIGTVGFAVGYCLMLLAVSAIYAAAAYLLYRKRKAEDVSKPFVFNIFYYAIMACIMLSLSTFILIEDDFAFPLVIFMAVVYLIFEVINKRGFKKFKSSLVRCALTIAACIGISLLCKSTNGFGVSYRVPDAGSVKSVTISYIGPEQITYYWGGSLDDSNSITVVDTATIENIIAAHKSIIKRYDESRNDFYYYDDSTETVRIDYNLKNGTGFSRMYEMTADEMYYLSYVCHDSNYESEIGRILRNYFLDNDRISVNAENGRGLTIDKRSDGTERYNSVAKAIASAYAKDLADRTTEQIVFPSEDPIAYISARYRSLYIYSWDENMIELMKEYGIDISYVYEIEEG